MYAELARAWARNMADPNLAQILLATQHQIKVSGQPITVEKTVEMARVCRSERVEVLDVTVSKSKEDLIVEALTRQSKILERLTDRL